MPQTYESHGVSPLPASTLPTELELLNHITRYEKELQTLHMIQGQADMQNFMEEVIRENPIIFENTNLLTECCAQLAEDPHREILHSILTASALHATSSAMPISPEPLPVPPRSTPTEREISAAISSGVNSKEADDGHETTSPSPSPVPSDRAHQVMEFFNALDATPKGISACTDLSDPGWHVAPNPEASMSIPMIQNTWDSVPASFLCYFLNQRSGSPTWEGAEGDGTGIYGEPLKAVP
jgi:hypothetical protein